MSYARATTFPLAVVCFSSSQASWNSSNCAPWLITTDKQNPKDIDFLVVVDDDLDLEPLARLGRKIKGRAQQLNRGADIFLADVQGRYIGRTCSWKRCGAGIRRSCDALNCGKRHYLHDDLETVTLSEGTVRAALVLWPSLERRVGLPDDLKEILKQLEA